ncbi:MULTISPECIES: acetate--CoA ligase [unclassified Colwellia]|uniref:acetate--CoA ligase n=1 Tax=unclassified Colwellia TaxID=196834 RepID=UPI0015F44E0B|nr:MULTISPECIES: acetate--CoA ligase [unclassified Colwellia]MBA6234030.1 acetate--CoA ligase [Colwellia sp. MB02u-7]MBA6238048.1 acetate--CoA ligase [Colwellia sp. MB02u-11]MBA6257625.1 acetate--CoA ligase [Colwellia sp. MB3u-28]MBA6259382.1 acetate--CoA ligase [Colwellia sp. MB3u-41]MBA6300704.1 acetate--CoA ligase [Colwellia sp. MB3u-22]
MHKKIINKYTSDNQVSNLPDYQQCYQHFNWPSITPQLNIAYQAVDSHLNTPNENKIALRWLGKQNQCVDFTYRDLAEQTSRFASVLNTLGLEPCSRVFSLAGRLPLLYIAALGTLKAGCVFTPLFSDFGPEPIRSRMEIGEANVLVTTMSLYRKKVAKWWQELPHLKAILLIDGVGVLDDGCYAVTKLMENANAGLPCVKTSPDDMALLHFTSGTTGKPKGVVHVHHAVVAHKSSAYYALDIHATDIYWCTADPGWVTGTTYGIIAPLCLGATMIVDEAEFDVERWYQILEQQQVNVWYSAPTAIRLLMKAGCEIRAQYDLSHLRFIASVGEPLNPEAVVWSERVLGLPFHDNWWQTETGAIMIANYASMPIKPGAMGLPLPGIEAGIVKRTNKESEQVTLEVLSEANQIGELALKQGWPSMFRGYLHQNEKYQHCFTQGWYLSGDLAYRDEQGYYWFVGRADDLIKSSGHLIGPFEVESALMEHEDVIEVGVIGIPDDIAGEVVKAYVTLKSGVIPSEQLQKQLKGFARKKLGAAVAPKEIVFRQNLPKTRSGKIMRRLLKARELGLPLGDISTLESDEQ